MADGLLSGFCKQYKPQTMTSTMTKKAELPDDFKHSKCKRGNIAKQGGSLPLIQFIHPKAKSDKKVATATIYTLRNVKEEFSSMPVVTWSLPLHAYAFLSQSWRNATSAKSRKLHTFS